MNDLISIIIRTKDEERWIGQCLQEIFNQSYKNFEVILVDNESLDKTLEKVKQFNIQKVVTCHDYRPGKALNLGIREAKGKFIVCVSGHCIPVNQYWLSNLIRNFNDPEVAGVYGRQEPLSFTADSDKRDLSIIFGLDKKIQKKDGFFHNANSMIRADLWKKSPFDEHTTNIEDRLWAQAMLRLNYKIVYEPEASVYHYHGIHQNGDPKRCSNVVRILQNLNAAGFKSLQAEKLNIVSLIPVRGPAQFINDVPLMLHTIRRSHESKYIRKTIVTTDNEETADLARQLGAEVPFIRESSFSKDYVDLSKVLQYSLNKLEELKIYPDLIVSLEPTFPFRPKGFIDNLILQLTQGGLDTVVAAKRENKALWKEKDGQIHQLDEGLTPRQFKEASYIELRGIGCVTYPEFLRQGNLVGSRIGICEVENPYASLEVRTEADFKMVAPLLNHFFG